ncbi:neural/ectodermal development factor IMP-L2-like [Pectinophora gossypiella]|uniref:Hemolin n=1 Tax=Pectinophora gossypiella TaxID=13191 RepID=A0A1E1WQL1_PECGO|nr:neural/ectodermal development factor IMP-L2-like [Pectinophora gossypiella]XP_049882340.1 neural/ectodermal development factor IMP-L2-like [Pectinophora gossypiella]
MRQLVLVFAALLACSQTANVDRHVKLISELDNTIENNALPTTKQYRKFVALTSRPAGAVEHPAGAPLELTCAGVGAPAPSVRWFKNDAPIYEHDLESNEIIDANPTSLARVTSSLLIPTTQDQDTYTCVISAGLKTARASTIVYSDGDGSTDEQERAKLTPLTPRILVSYKVFIDLIGNSIVLPCKVRGHPRPHVTWKDNKGNFVKNNPRMKVLRSGELVISSLRWTDMGEFTCHAENAFGSKHATTFVYPAKAG